MDYSTDWLVANVQRMESVATSSQTFSEDDIVEFLNLELQSTVVPTIQSVNEEFGVFYEEFTSAELGTTVQIPAVATGARLRSVQLISPANYITAFPRLSPDSIGKRGAVWPQSAGYYIRNNELVFYPYKPQGNFTLRLNYFRRPNVLVPATEAGRVLSIDTVGNTVTLDNTPTTNWAVGENLDIIEGEQPFDFRVQSTPIVNITGPVIELDPAVIAEVQVGDYLARQGESPVVQFVPIEALYLLSQLAGCRCLQALGDTEGWKLSVQKAESMKTMLLNMVSDRIAGNPQKIVARPITRRFRW